MHWVTVIIESLERDRDSYVRSIRIRGTLSRVHLDVRVSPIA